MSKSQEQTTDNNTLQHLNDEREKYNAKLQNWGEELARKVAEKRKNGFGRRKKLATTTKYVSYGFVNGISPQFEYKD